MNGDVVVVARRYGKYAFLLLVLLYTAALGYQSLSYSADARLFPLLAAIFVLVVGIIWFVRERLRSTAEPTETGLLQSVEELSGSDVEPAEAKTSPRKHAEVTLWIFGIYLAVWLFGLMKAAPIYTALFVYRFRNDVREALIVALLTSAILYVLFVIILSAQLWNGVLF